MTKNVVSAFDEDVEEEFERDTWEDDSEERAHQEFGAGGALACYCGIGHDHTYDEWVEWETEE